MERRQTRRPHAHTVERPRGDAPRPAPETAAAARPERSEGPAWLDRPALGAGLLLALFAAAVYVATLAPTIAGGDSGDLVAAAYTLGVAHPPGYPLYVMLGKLFALLPWGDVAYRLNLLSALSAAGAVFVVYLVVLRLTRRVVTAVVGAATLAFSPLFWSYALVAEVFALNSLFAGLLLLLALQWRAAPVRRRWLYALAGVAGLSLTHQQIIALLFLPLLYLLWPPLRRLLAKPHAFAVTAGLFLVGLLPYAFLPLAAARRPAQNWGDPATLERFLAVVTRADYGSFVLVSLRADLAALPWQLSLYANALLQQYAPWGLALALLGLVHAWRRSPRLGIFLLAAFLLSGPAFVLYANVAPDLPGALAMLQKFYLLSFLLCAVLIGLGARALSDWIGRRRSLPVPAKALGAVLLVLPLSLLILNWRAVDQSGDYLGRQFAGDLLATMSPNAVLLTYSDDGAFILRYEQLVAGTRPDVTLINPALLAKEWYRRQVGASHPDLVLPAYQPTVEALARDFVRRNIARRPIYVYGTAGDDLAASYELAPRGLVLAVHEKGKGPDLDALRAENELLWQDYARRWAGRHDTQASWQRNIRQDYALPIFVLALRYQNARRYAEASELYEQALRLSPDFAPAYANLGDVYWNGMRDPARALPYLERFLALQPYSDPAPQVRADVALLQAMLDR